MCLKVAKGEGKGGGVKCVSENVQKEVIFFTVASLIGNKIAVDGILNVIVIEYNFVLSLSEDIIRLHLILMEDIEIVLVFTSHLIITEYYKHENETICIICLGIQLHSILQFVFYSSFCR